MASVAQGKYAYDSLFAEGVVQPEKILALDTEQLRCAVQLCRTYDEEQNKGVKAECDQNLYALPEAFFADLVVDGAGRVSSTSGDPSGHGLDRAAEAMRRVSL